MDSYAVDATVSSQLYVNAVSDKVLGLMGIESGDRNWQVRVNRYNYVSSKSFAGWAVSVVYKGDTVASTPKFDIYTDPFRRKVNRELKKVAKRARLLA